MLYPFKVASITELLDGAKKKEKSITHNIEISNYNSFDEAEVCDSPTE